MSEKFWLEIACCFMSCVFVIGVMTTKIPGWGKWSVQAMVLALAIPAVVILGLEKLIDSQAIAGAIGAAIGIGLGKTAKD